MTPWPDRFLHASAPPRIKDFVCKGTVKHLADEAGKPGSYSLHNASGGGIREQLLQARRDTVPVTAGQAS